MQSTTRSKSARARFREARYERLFKQEQLAAKMLEGLYPYGDQWGDYVDPTRRYPADGVTGLSPLNALVDIRRGAAYGVFRTELELADIRNMARLVSDGNMFIVGALNGLSTYIVGDGFTYTAFPKPEAENEVGIDSLTKLVQREIDDFINENLWQEWEQGIFVESRIDGEKLIRHSTDEEILQVRAIEPEQITQPATIGNGENCEFGVYVDPVDQQKVIGYNVSYDGQATNGEYVEADEIEHYKVNVRRMVRRGLSDMYPIGEAADDLKTLIRNMRRGASILSTIAWIEQFENASQDQVKNFADLQKKFDRIDTTTGKTDRYEQFLPGQVHRIPKGKNYIPPPLATANVPGFVEICRLSRQALCVRWNAPESLFGDASNGSFSSLSVAESPFVRNAEKAQKFYGRRFKRTIIRAINHAISLGRLPANALQLVDINVEAPTVIVRDRLALAKENETKLLNGIIAPQTWAAQDGEDWEKEQSQIKKAKEAGWTPAQASSSTMAGGIPKPLGSPSPTTEAAVTGVLSGLGHWGS